MFASPLDLDDDDVHQTCEAKLNEPGPDEHEQKYDRSEKHLSPTSVAAI
jgi:hypothetical protein